MAEQETLLNYVDNQWQPSQAAEQLPVANPATAELLAYVPLSPAAEVDDAVQAAFGALDSWRRTPVVERVQFLFRLKNLLEENLADIARTITLECGKTYGEAVGEMRRAIENVEVACGAPILMQGAFSEDVASGVDEYVIRQPVGVCAVIAPFNFPGMIPFWFLPYAIACGNTMVVKPSERVPLTMQKVFRLLDAIDLPPGVVNLVNGGGETATALLEHPLVQAVSFVGSTRAARQVYARAAQHGKRVQAQGGAKNPMIVLPDADMDMTSRIAADSAFGCAGQRCLAASLAITVGDARRTFSEAIGQAAADRVVGFGLDEGVEMGPVISAQSRAAIEHAIQQAADEGASLLVDGRRPAIAGYEQGHFVRPTVLQDIDPDSELARTEIFGPVLGLLHVASIEEAIALTNSGQYGNMACLFTSSGAAARQFRYEAQVGNVGINIGVAAPMAFFPFSGWKESFFGDLHGQAHHAVEFFTQTKVVVERWPRQWARRF